MMASLKEGSAGLAIAHCPLGSAPGAGGLNQPSFASVTACSLHWNASKCTWPPWRFGGGKGNGARGRGGSGRAGGQPWQPAHRRAARRPPTPRAGARGRPPRPSHCPAIPPPLAPTSSLGSKDTTTVTLCPPNSPCGARREGRGAAGLSRSAGSGADGRAPAPPLQPAGHPAAKKSLKSAVKARSKRGQSAVKARTSRGQTWMVAISTTSSPLMM
jgi:hypothetical protein